MTDDKKWYQNGRGQFIATVVILIVQLAAIMMQIGGLKAQIEQNQRAIQRLEQTLIFDQVGKHDEKP